MKTLLTITYLLTASVLFAQAQQTSTTTPLPQDTPAAGPVALVSKAPDPKLVIIRQATGSVEEGRSKFLKSTKSAPPGSAFILANGGLNAPSKGEINVVVLGYSFAEAEEKCTYNNVLHKKAETFKIESIIADMNAAGYRPATAEQVSAVRAKLTGIRAADDILLRVFGTVLKKEESVYTMGVDYHYILGTDILAYGDGMSKVGFYGDTDWCKDQLYLAAVKIDEGKDEKVSTVEKKGAKKPDSKKKKK